MEITLGFRIAEKTARLADKMPDDLDKVHLPLTV